MKAVRLFVLNLLMLVLAACNGAGDSETVKINTGGIFNPVSLSTNNVEIQPIHDLGEFLLGTPKKVFTFQIRNNSLYYINQVGVTLEGFSSFGFKFNKDPIGGSAYPGYTGTCADSLPPGGVCTVVLQFETSIKGQYEQDITFHYKNLIEEASRPLKLLMLAGNPASLVFDGEETNYTFGELVGLGKVPVVEKEDKVVLEKTLNVTNAGDLRARDIKLVLSQVCAAQSTGSCPIGQGTAYSFTTNCPAILPADATCQATIKFAPQNFDIDIALPDPDLAEIRFTSTLKYNYLNSMEGPNNKAALNAYFTSVSTRIEGNLKTSIDSLPFDTQITVGNRIQKSVRINNKGFREGQLRHLIVRKAGVDIGWCVRESSSLLMDCYSDEALTVPLSLASFPFYFKDRHSCFGTLARTDGALVEVDGGCQLDMFFQPSNTYKTNGVYNFSIKARFDTRWKDNETLKTNFLLDSSGTYLSAARIIPEKVTFGTANLTATSLSPYNEISSFYMGRIGMMSPNSFKRKILEITFYNAGSVVADAVSAMDGWNIEIPKKEDNPIGVQLKPAGGDNKPLYTDAKISTSYCTQIPPGGRCTVTMNYAPISKGSVEATRLYQYDLADTTDPLQSVKRFFVSYNDGSLYSDTNRTDTVDSGPASSQAQLKVNLVAKGILGDFYENYWSKTGGPFPPELTMTAYAFVTNIGTDKIRYIGFTGSGNLKTANSGYKVIASDLTAVASANSSRLYGPLKDCKDIFDMNYSTGQTCAMVDAKIYSVGNPGGKGFLAPDEACVLTIERYPTLANYTDVVSHELQRTVVQELMGTVKTWEYPALLEYADLRMDYFDNDLGDPSPAGTLGACVGGLVEGDKASGIYQFAAPARINPHTPYPNSSAIIYRRGYSLPDLINSSNVVVKTTAPLTEKWFAGPDNTDGTVSSQDVDIVSSFKSKNHFPSMVNLSPIDMSQYDYVVHLGSFPVGQTVPAGFALSGTAASLQAKWKGSTSATILKPGTSVTSGQFTYSVSIPYDKPITGGALAFPKLGEDIRVNVRTDVEGVFASEFNYSYSNGDYTDPSDIKVVQQKILVLAEGVADAPDLEVNVASYIVTTDGFSAPVLTPTGPTGFISSDYSSYLASAGDLSNNEWITLDAVKTASPTSVDFFVRKQIKITNKSLTLPLNNLKLIPKSSPAATVVMSLGTSANIKFCFDNSSTLCKGTCGTVTTLAPGASCYFETFFQPNEGLASKDVTIAAIFRVKDNQFFSRNINLSFIPKDPANLLAVGKTKDSVRVNLGNIQSYSLDLLTTTEITSDPQIIAFDKTSGTSKRVEVQNSSVTRASFLKAYHEFKNTTNINMIPADADYNYSSDGVNYALIYQRSYPNGQPRIQVYATKPCLIGGATAEDDALPLFKKGFSSTTTAKCYLGVVLKANSHYMNVDLVTATAALMEPNHVRLPYYNNDRSSFSYFNLHFIGKLKPNGSTGAPNNASAYTSVQATSDGVVTFKWAEMAPKNPALGPIVGYRIYYSTSQTALDNIYLAQASKVDDFNVPNGTGIYQMTQNALASKKYYYYRVVPIREYANYTPTVTFPGVTPFYQLTGKRFLSETLVPKIGVVIPPPDMFYDHPSQLLIYRAIKATDLLTIAQARTACTSMAKLRLSRSGANADFTQRLITETAWQTIIARPTESTVNPYSFTQWLDGTTQNIHATLLPIAGYTPNDEAKYLTADHIFYQKKNNCQPTCPGNKAVGTVYHNPEYVGYTSYVSDNYVYGSARCHVNLNSP